MFTHSIQGCLDSTIGGHGLSQERLQHWLTALEPGFASLRAKAQNGGFAHFEITRETADIAEAQAAVATLSQGAKTIFILGTGGSSLGGQTLAQLGGWCIPGDNGAPSATKRPRLRFYDNLDARSFIHGIDAVDLATSRFVVISKSGGTAETLSQMLTVFARIEAAGLMDRVPGLFLAISDPRGAAANGLRDLCDAYGIRVLDHPAAIGGRYSGLSVVGLIPLILRGLDPYAVRRGAAEIVDALAASAAPADFAPAVGAALSIGLARDRGATVAVMMPYSDRLERFAAWYVQLWAESLGKNDDGTTPLAALGPVDQHSQMQLYLGGARRHFTTVIRAHGPKAGLPVISPDLAKRANSAYLGGFTIADLVEAQGRAIADAFVEAKRPVRTIDIDTLDERAIGGLMMHFVCETVLASHLLGVDPFDQPAVELGKRITREYLARMTPRG